MGYSSLAILPDGTVGVLSELAGEMIIGSVSGFTPGATIRIELNLPQ
ncbi:hypothetical protein HMPREF0044_0734 [Gleimia coleocanis DSM 15436]|uniref:Uncharacterized protein n=1 Tax=Gleimia coleocanis DSM 15436 TaxID=525245 RepID=C0W0Z1_9ACTO|nr:hypothetical protein [Gleimia coleocanis]EEH63715.1 hypothetical protein HMPREF0044_0734 [Gleimia coleocanis DSM 15436]